MNTDIDSMRQLVRRYKLCWSSAPAYGIMDDPTRVMGATVEISASEDHLPHAPSIACTECLAVREAIERVVGFMLIPIDRTLYDVHVSFSTMAFSSTHSGMPEVTATVTLMSEGEDRRTDISKQPSLNEVVSQLRQIGACEGHWDEAKS